MLEQVTIIYYDSSSLELKHITTSFEHAPDQSRIIIPTSFKANKTIIAVCKGKVNILNKLGDRILPSEELEIAVTGHHVDPYQLNLED